jgi:hypothetical protein
MLFTDALSFDHPRKTQDGYLVVRARAARAGIYDYLGAEVDPKGEHGFAADQTVKVYRPESEVFAADSVASFLMKPVTNDHPSQPVTAANWRDNAKGVVGKALRDGEYLAFDIVLMDKGIIDSVESGKRELSNGYASMLDFSPGETETGDAYDAVQRQIRGNHVAVVDKGRAGPMCRISDAAACDNLPGADLVALLTDERTYSGASPDVKNAPSHDGMQDGDAKMPHTLIIDGLQVTEVSDQAKAAIEKLQGQVTALTADKAALDTELAAKDAAIDDLKTKVVDQAKIDALADAKAAVVADAKTIAGDKLGGTAGKSVAEVRRMACIAALGDAALKDKSDEYIEARFDTLKDSKHAQRDPVRDTLSTGVRSQINDNGVSVRDLARASQF